MINYFFNYHLMIFSLICKRFSIYVIFRSMYLYPVYKNIYFYTMKCLLLTYNIILFFRTQQFIILSSMYAQLVVVICVAFFISEIVTPQVPLLYFEVSECFSTIIKCYSIYVWLYSSNIVLFKILIIFVSEIAFGVRF